MARRTETLSRKDFFQVIGDLDGDIADQLREELAQWEGGESCEWVRVSVNSLGNLDSESSPSPA
jgi:ABC-type transporter Mla MlaB component